MNVWKAITQRVKWVVQPDDYPLAIKCVKGNLIKPFTLIALLYCTSATDIISICIFSFMVQLPSIDKTQRIQSR